MKTLTQIVTELADDPTVAEFNIHGAAGLLVVHVANPSHDIYIRYRLTDDSKGYVPFESTATLRAAYVDYARKLQAAGVKRSVAALILGVTETKLGSYLRAPLPSANS